MRLLIENFSVDKVDVERSTVTVPHFAGLSLAQVLEQMEQNFVKKLLNQCRNMSVLRTETCVFIVSNFGAIRISQTK